MGFLDPTSLDPGISSLTGGGGISSLFGGGSSGGIPGLPSGASIYGSKPVVPTNLAASQQSISDANTLLPGATALASNVNAFTQQQKSAMMSFVTPDWQKNLGLAGADITKMLQGELPQSDVAQSQLSSVSRAIGGGYGDSPAMRNLVARDLGITQQQEINQGLAANDRWIKTAESLQAPQMDFTKLFPSRQDEFSREWQQNLITAAPDPVARGTFDEINSLLGMVLGVYSGGPGYRGISGNNYGGATTNTGLMGATAPDGSSFDYQSGPTTNVNIDTSGINQLSGGWEGM